MGKSGLIFLTSVLKKSTGLDQKNKQIGDCRKPSRWLNL